MLRRSCRIIRTKQQNRSFLRRNQTTDGCGSVPVVVSRQAWQRWRAGNPLPDKPPAPTKKVEEKPWPQSLQVLGYSAMAIGIPYSIGWYLSSDHQMREMLGLPESVLSVLRRHFGHPESIPWEEHRGEVGQLQYKLEGEEPYQVRNQQNLIEGLKKEETVVHFSRDGVTETKLLPGHLLVNAPELGAEPGVALDFEDLGPKSADFEQDSLILTQAPASERQVYSSWHYQPQIQQDSTAQKPTSDVDMKIAKLEYQIQQLEQELHDINSTRDMDDMRAELNKAKSTLGSLRWRRRLGMA